MTKVYKGSCAKSIFEAIKKSSRGKWMVRFNTVEQDDVVTYDEIVMDSKPDYSSIVSALIRIRYSLDAEIALSRQRESKQAEWQEYYDFCELAKVEAKKIIG